MPLLLVCTASTAKDRVPDTLKRPEVSSRNNSVVVPLTLCSSFVGSTLSTAVANAVRQRHRLVGPAAEACAA